MSTFGTYQFSVALGNLRIVVEVLCFLQATQRAESVVAGQTVVSPSLDIDSREVDDDLRCYEQAGCESRREMSEKRNSY